LLTLFTAPLFTFFKSSGFPSSIRCFRLLSPRSSYVALYWILVRGWIGYIFLCSGLDDSFRPFCFLPKFSSRPVGFVKPFFLSHFILSTPPPLARFPFIDSVTMLPPLTRQRLIDQAPQNCIPSFSAPQPFLPLAPQQQLHRLYSPHFPENLLPSTIFLLPTFHLKFHSVLSPTKLALSAPPENIGGFWLLIFLSSPLVLHE